MGHESSFKFPFVLSIMPHMAMAHKIYWKYCIIANTLQILFDSIDNGAPLLDYFLFPTHPTARSGIDGNGDFVLLDSFCGQHT
jgi:hypothetical protein